MLRVGNGFITFELASALDSEALDRHYRALGEGSHGGDDDESEATDSHKPELMTAIMERATRSPPMTGGERREQSKPRRSSVAQPSAGQG